MLLALLFISPAIPAHRYKIGNALYCVVSSRELYCADHTLAQCLRTVSLTLDGTACIINPYTEELLP